MTRGMGARTMLAVSVMTGALACSAPPEAPPELELAADPARTPNAPPSAKGAPEGAPPLMQSDVVMLPSPVPVTDAGVDASSQGGGEGGAATDAGPLYEPRCNGYLASDREHESNDTLATANVFDRLACSGIESANDVDWFVVDTQIGLAFTFNPENDAEITVTKPSGVSESTDGTAFYSSPERGRYAIRVRSPLKRTQTYLLVRN